MEHVAVVAAIAAAIAIAVVLIRKRMQTQENMEAIVVPPEVGAKLFEHLSEQGRVTAFTGSRDAHVKLTQIVTRMWGTPDARRFDDEFGGGWLFDISKAVDGEALHAIARTVVGKRTVMAVVDEVEVENFLEKGEWESADARRTDPLDLDEDVLKVVAEMEGRDKPAPTKKATEAPRTPTVAEDKDDPMLIVITNSSNEPLSILRYTREEVPGAIKTLLQMGFQGEKVTEDQLEIWSKMSKPKVEVRF